MLQVQVDYENVSDAAITPTLYVVAISQGLFTLYNGQALRKWCQKTSCYNPCTQSNIGFDYRETVAAA